MTPKQERVVFFYSLGGALSQWTNVERAIFGALSPIFEDKHLQRESLGLGYFSLEGFRAKVNFVDKAVERRLRGTQHIDDWKKIVDKARALNGSRNKLAHWNVAHYLEEQPGQRIVLQPWVMQKPKRDSGVPKKRPKGSLTTRDIGKLAMEFMAFAVRVQNFTAGACQLPEPHAKSDEQPTHPPTTPQLVRLIREELANPPAPSKAKR